MMRHPTEPGQKWICPITNRPFKHSWTNHALPECYNECPECALEHEMTVGERLAKLNESRKREEKR